MFYYVNFMKLIFEIIFYHKAEGIQSLTEKESIFDRNEKKNV